MFLNEKINKKTEEKFQKLEDNNGKEKNNNNFRI